MAANCPALLRYVQTSRSAELNELETNFHDFIWNGGSTIYLRNQEQAISIDLAAQHVFRKIGNMIGNTIGKYELSTQESNNSRNHCLIRVDEDLFFVAKETLVNKSQFFHSLLCNTQFQPVNMLAKLPSIAINIRDIVPEIGSTTLYSFWLFLLIIEGVPLETIIPHDEQLFKVVHELIQLSHYFGSPAVIEEVDRAFAKIVKRSSLTIPVIVEGLALCKKYDLKMCANQLLCSLVVQPSFNGAMDALVLPLLARYGSFLQELPGWVTKLLTPLGFERIYEHCPAVRQISLEVQKLVQLDTLPTTTAALELHAPNDITVDALNLALSFCSQLQAFRCYDIPTDFQQIIYPTSLQELYFENCKGFNDGALKNALQQVVHLKKLTLSGGDCTFQGITLPAGLETLCVQNVGSVSDDQLRAALEPLNSLYELDVRGTFILLTDEQLPTSLRILRLSEAQIVTQHEIDAIFNQCPNLQEIYCSSSHEGPHLSLKKVSYYPHAGYPHAELTNLLEDAYDSSV